MNENMKINKAAEILLGSGVLVRSEDEKELLGWFRKLPAEGQQIELARAQGMSRAMDYARMEVNRR